jgi:hypothetical protein
MNAESTPKTSVSLELPQHTLAELAQLRESVARYGVLSALVKTPSGITIQGRAVEAVAKDLHIPPDKVTVILADVADEETDMLRVRLELGGRDRSALRGLLEQVLIANPHLTSRDIARKLPELGDRRTVDRARQKLLASGAIVPVPRVDKRGYSHQPPAVLTTARQSDAIGRKMEAARDHLQGGMISRRQLNAAIKLKAREEYAQSAPRTTPKHIQIRNCDFRKLTYPAEHFDLVIADPPWSKPWSDRDRRDFAARVFGAVKPQGFVIAYSGHHQLLEWADLYRAAGLLHRWSLTVVWHDGPAMRNALPGRAPARGAPDP